MSDRKPLVLDDTASIQQLQAMDELNPDATGLAPLDEFRCLQRNFRLLIGTLNSNGVELPFELLQELERI